MKPSDVLDEAAIYIEKFGWFKNVNGKQVKYPTNKSRKAGTYCALTAIGWVEQDYDKREHVEDLLVEYIDPKFVGNDPVDTIVAWNDAQPNKYNVIRKLRAVAKKLRAKGQ